MSQFLGLVRHELNMSIRRKGLWISYSVVFVFYSIVLFTPPHSGPADVFSSGLIWREAGESVYFFNLLMPLVGGILAADRMQRDVRLGVRELQVSAPLGRVTYVLGKYVGVLLSILLPMFLWVMAISTLAIASGQAQLLLAGAVAIAFMAIAVPSFAFVVAFSLACPLVVPLRVYQILFTGYWFWGNFLSPEVIPTVSGTLLNASGIYAQQGFFRGLLSKSVEELHTPLEAWLNILVLGTCAAAVLFVLDRYLAWRARRA
jgi:ABC-2 type transport system permease protein